LLKRGGASRPLRYTPFPSALKVAMSGWRDGMQSQGKLESMREAMDEWERTTLRRALDAWPERYDEFVTTSGEPVKRLFTPDDVAGLDYQRDLGFPGQYPFTRGVHPTMYRGRLWTMRMFAGFGSAEETNERYKYLLAHGETGLSVAFDFPTLYGYDTDHPLAEGEFGKCGVAVSSLADMEMLFSGIPVDRITTSMTINGPAAVIWAMYIAAAERHPDGRAGRHHPE
jgi:methylmalonyl-CoA mutase N-terminal domain/subunit